MLDNDPIYQECIRQARMSPCQKMGFGAVLVAPKGIIIAREHNRPIKGLEGLCQPTCIRLKIQSRTKSMIGACGHAEERLIWDVIKRGYGPFFESFCLHVAGTTQRQLREFTCLRCAVAMHYSGLVHVKIAYMGCEWVELTAEQCLQQAKAYALGEKKV